MSLLKSWHDLNDDISRHHLVIIIWTYEKEEKNKWIGISLMFKDKIAQFEKDKKDCGRIYNLLCVYNIHQLPSSSSSSTANIQNKAKERTTTKLYANLFIRRLHIYEERGLILFFLLSSSLTKREMRCIVKNVHCAIYIYLW